MSSEYIFDLDSPGEPRLRKWPWKINDDVVTEVPSTISREEADRMLADYLSKYRGADVSKKKVISQNFAE